MKLLFAVVFVSALLVSACGSEPKDESMNNDYGQNSSKAETADAPAATTVASANAAPPAFAQCRSCHTIEKGGRNGVGPNLWNVEGHPAAQNAGFSYSPAMKASGLIWDEATLDRYLKEPMKTVAGTKMAFAGLKNDEQRAQVIAYMKTSTE